MVLRAGVLLLAAGGCDGAQSALDPAGREADTLAALFWLMLAGAAVIWLCVIGAAVYASWNRDHAVSETVARRFLIGGGVIFPVVGLGALLAYGLTLMADLRPSHGGLRIIVTGEQWWWRVVYEAPGRNFRVVTANEIRLPVGEATELILESRDVIHSFWIPAIAGKLDMIPGRTTRLVVQPSRAGIFRGACAEFCGTSHALMAFAAVVMEKEGFDAWLEREARPADEPADPRAQAGRALFRDVGCGGCHTIRGTDAAGTIGPDLTHVAGRRTIGAGILPNEPAALERWIAHTGRVKPAVKMPSFGVLGEERVAALAAYLASLR